MKRILVVDDDPSTRLVLSRVLRKAGFSAEVAKDGKDALRTLRTKRFDLLLLDVWMPRMGGLDLLAALRGARAKPRVVVMTSDDAPETLLKAVRQQAIRYVHKPVETGALLQIVHDVLRARALPRIEVVSATPNWVEIVAPCTHETADRLEEVMTRLKSDLPPDLRESLAYAFRELLMNAIEWGGRLDPKRKVRIAYLRARRMVLYRIADPGPGFDIANLPHAAIGHPPENPIQHMTVRETKGIRPGGFGLVSVRESVDELLYNEKRNEVVFVKYL